VSQNIYEIVSWDLTTFTFIEQLTHHYDIMAVDFNLGACNITLKLFEQEFASHFCNVLRLRLFFCQLIDGESIILYEFFYIVKKLIYHYLGIFFAKCSF